MTLRPIRLRALAGKLQFFWLKFSSVNCTDHFAMTTLKHSTWQNACLNQDSKLGSLFLNVGWCDILPTRLLRLFPKLLVLIKYILKTRFYSSAATVFQSAPNLLGNWSMHREYFDFWLRCGVCTFSADILYFFFLKHFLGRFAVNGHGLFSLSFSFFLFVCSDKT